MGVLAGTNFVNVLRFFYRDFPHRNSYFSRNRVLDKRGSKVNVSVSLVIKANCSLLKDFSNRGLLKRSGDVESNPGPILGSGSLSLSAGRCRSDSESLPALSSAAMPMSTSTPTFTFTSDESLPWRPKH